MGTFRKIKELLEAQVEGLKSVASEPSAKTPGLQEVPNVFQNPAALAVTFDAGISAIPQANQHCFWLLFCRGRRMMGTIAESC